MGRNHGRVEANSQGNVSEAHCSAWVALPTSGATSLSLELSCTHIARVALLAVTPCSCVLRKARQPNVVHLQEILSCYFEEVVRGNFPVPPARFKTLDDYEEVEGEPMPDEDRESFLCLLPCRITFEETRAWMARKRVVSHTHYM